MFTVHKIASLDLPELQPYRTMRHQAEHREQGIFVAEGEKVVRRLLESHLKVISLLLPEEWVRELEPLLQARLDRDRCRTFSGVVRNLIYSWASMVFPTLRISARWSAIVRRSMCKPCWSAKPAAAHSCGERSVALWARFSKSQ